MVKPKKQRNAEMQQYAKELHKPVIHSFKQRRVNQYEKDYIWSADLVDMSEWSKENNKRKFILTVIDIGSRYAWAKPLMNKEAKTVSEAFENIITESKRNPKMLWVVLNQLKK